MNEARPFKDPIATVFVLTKFIGTQKSSRLVQDILYGVYEYAKSDEEALAEINKMFKQNENKDNKPTLGKSKHKTLKTVEFVGNADETLIALAKTLNREVFVVIDALDECADKDDEDLYRTLQAWVSEIPTQDASYEPTVMAKARVHGYS